MGHYSWFRERPRRRGWAYSAPTDWLHRSPRPDPDQLDLLDLLKPPAQSFRERARANLRALLRRSELAQRDFATMVLGCAEFTLTRYLRGARIPHDRAVFLSRLESVALDGDVIVITVRAGGVRRLPWWRLRRRR